MLLARPCADFRRRQTVIGSDYIGHGWGRPQSVQFFIITRAPCRRVIHALGQRATAAR